MRIFVISLAGLFFVQSFVHPVNHTELMVYIRQRCIIESVPLELALAILAEENDSYKASAVHKNANGSYDYGLWQLNSQYLWADFIPRYWDRGYAFKWDNPLHSTYIAVRHIAALIRYFSTGYAQPYNALYWKVALAYNCGLGSVLSGKVADRSIDYASRVLSHTSVQSARAIP